MSVRCGCDKRMYGDDNDGDGDDDDGDGDDNDDDDGGMLPGGW